MSESRSVKSNDLAKGVANGDSPRVTVAMAAYNVAPFIGEAVDSVLGQSFPDFELIVVNDGSTDSTAEILRSYNDSRLRVLQQNNQGLAKTRNRIFSEARGEFIAIFDSDDVMLPNRLRNQLKYLDEHPDVSVVGGQFIETTEDGDVLSCCLTNPTDRELVRNQCVGRRMSILEGTAMLRRSVVEEIGGYREEFGSIQLDIEYFSRILARHDAVNLPEPVIRYRIRRDSACNVYHYLTGKRKQFIKRQHLRLAHNPDAEASRDELREIEPTPNPHSESVEKRAALATANYYCRLGRAALRGAKYRSAWRYYMSSIKVRPWQWLAYSGLLRVFLRKGSAPSAVIEDS